MPEKILFVCAENTGQSQMAGAFFRKIAPRKSSVLNAGTAPSSLQPDWNVSDLGEETADKVRIIRDEIRLKVLNFLLLLLLVVTSLEESIK